MVILSRWHDVKGERGFHYSYHLIICFSLYSIICLQMRMKHFLKYLKNNSDDSPLYIFDSRFENDSVSRSLLEDYKVPDYFKEDLFSLVGEKRRPPYR